MRLDSSASTQNNPSILLIGTQVAVGGAQKVLLDQAAWFHAHGYPVSAVFLYDRDGLYPQWSESYPFPIHNLEAFRAGSGVFRQCVSIFQGMQRLWKLLRQNRLQAVETFTLDSNLFALPVAWLAGVPVRIATNHGWSAKDSWPKRLAHNLLLKLGIVDRLVAVTEGIRSQSIREGVRPGLVITISNGIHLFPARAKNAEVFSKILQTSAGCMTLLSVGRLVHEKAYEILIRAIQLVVEEYPDVVLVIAGRGSLRDELQALIDSLHLADKIRLLGDRQDVSDLLTNADIFVMPSRSEGMPIALLEAMGSGLPVIATRVGGLSEVVEDRSQGILVPAEDPQELAKAILELLRDPALRSRLGRNARQRIEERYTTERMCRQYEKVITDLYREKNKHEAHPG